MNWTETARKQLLCSVDMPFYLKVWFYNAVFSIRNRANRGLLVSVLLQFYHCIFICFTYLYFHFFLICIMVAFVNFL